MAEEDFEALEDNQVLVQVTLHSAPLDLTDLVCSIAAIPTLLSVYIKSTIKLASKNAYNKICLAELTVTGVSLSYCCGAQLLHSV